VLLHAICDALLGAAALGDIGQHFSDKDPRWRGADSRVFLRHVRELLAQRNYGVVNVDSTVLAEEPRIGTFCGEMCRTIAADLQIASDRVSVKATTTEKMGYIGRGEGLACEAIALLELR
jgi:2-C-methyl-D-erythritol 2,4-cyclodiphosphate synthase